MRRLLLLLALGAATPLVAQDPDEEMAAVPFRTSYFPYVTSTPNDGLFGVARIVRFQQAPWDARVTNFTEQSLDAGYSTRGSYLVRGDYHRIWSEEGWRLRARAEATREVRFGDSDPIEGPGEREYLRRDRQLGSIDLTRRVAGRLHVALRGAVDRQSYRGDYYEVSSRYPEPIPTDGVIVCVTEPCPGSGVSRKLIQNDAQLRGALVFDSRNVEYDPQRGVLAEVGAFAGSAGDGYSGVYGVARGWVPLHRLTRVSARVSFRAHSRTTAIGVRHEIPAWEQTVTTFGGSASQRALPVGAVVGRGVLLGGVELRHTLLDFGGFGAISALAFVDGGRTFRDPSPLEDFGPGMKIPSGNLRLTLEDWTVSAGGGLGIRVLRAAQLNVTAAKANGSMRWYVTSGWSW